MLTTNRNLSTAELFSIDLLCNPEQIQGQPFGTIISESEFSIALEELAAIFRIQLMHASQISRHRSPRVQKLLGSLGIGGDQSLMRFRDQSTEHPAIDPGFIVDTIEVTPESATLSATALSRDRAGFTFIALLTSQISQSGVIQPRSIPDELMNLISLYFSDPGRHLGDQWQMNAAALINLQLSDCGAAILRMKDVLREEKYLLLISDQESSLSTHLNAGDFAGAFLTDLTVDF